jgi:NAD(P)-dependent dehydrogenase (short-subunit alcohol dehydrogenase family)
MRSSDAVSEIVRQPSLMDLASRVTLVTGSKRIGAVAAQALAARGADVAVCYRESRREADQIVGAVTRAGRRAVAIQADVADADSVTAMVAAVEAEFGRLDVLLNMASLYQAVPFARLTEHEWQRQMSVDLDGTYRVCAAAVPLMRRTGGGRIINFTDWVAASGRPRYTGYVAYYVAKAGVKALTEALALELAADGILVNAIAPGPILAPPDSSLAEQDAVTRATPLGRWGGAEEIAKAVLALVDSDFVTGETIRVDGGRHLY